MSTYFSYAAAILFCISLYTLARANGWAAGKSAVFLAASVGAPIAVIVFVFMAPALMSVSDILAGIAGIVPFVALFAVSKSVANRLNHKEAR